MTPKPSANAIDEPELNLQDLYKNQYLTQDFEVTHQLQEEAERDKFKPKWVPRNIAIFAALHVGALIGLYMLIFATKWQTYLWTIAVWFWSSLGIGAGAHRLWAHKSYKARWPLEVFLMLGFTLAFQNDVIEWCRDHRCHHKWTDTDADPHNTNRGFFFSHMGWLLQRKHPKLKEMGAKLDISDLTKNPILAFQRKFYLLLVAIMCFLLPTIIPVFFWGENAVVAFYTAGVFRYCILLHFTWMINSVCHFFGYKPYDARITPVESTWTSLVALGEGGHNYHHTFPQDYRTSEMPVLFNVTKPIIEFWAALGLAYDLKSVADEVIKRQKEKYGEKAVKGQ